MIVPAIADAREEMSTWARAMESALTYMLKDLRAGKTDDTTLETDFEAVRMEIRRHDQLLKNLKKAQGSMRGPGMPGHRESAHV